MKKKSKYKQHDSKYPLNLLNLFYLRCIFCLSQIHIVLLYFSLNVEIVYSVLRILSFRFAYTFNSFCIYFWYLMFQYTIDFLMVFGLHFQSIGNVFNFSMCIYQGASLAEVRWVVGVSVISTNGVKSNTICGHSIWFSNIWLVVTFCLTSYWLSLFAC